MIKKYYVFIIENMINAEKNKEKKINNNPITCE